MQVNQLTLLASMMLVARILAHLDTCSLLAGSSLTWIGNCAVQVERTMKEGEKRGRGVKGWKKERRRKEEGKKKEE